MRKVFIIIAGILSLLFARTYSQSSIDSIVAQVIKNNTALAALNKNIDAENVGLKTDILPQNPEFGFGYLWGSPSVIGNRTDMNITQSFDFPTAYVYKSQISKIKNEQLKFEYQKKLKEITLQAKLICFDLLYYNALKSEMSKRLTYAEKIAGSYKTKYELGETNVLEYNKAELNRLNALNELETIDIERTALLNELIGLNGNISVEFNDSAFPVTVIPNDFEQWYKQIETSAPQLNWLNKEIEVSQKQEKLNFALSLPELQTGYMSEKVVGENFQGVTVGISLPLWENRNKIKYAKLKTNALMEYEKDARLQHYNQLKTLYNKAVSLQSNINKYRSNLQTFSNLELLLIALNKGEINLATYIMEISFYFDSANKLLEMEREFNKTYAELMQYSD